MFSLSIVWRWVFWAFSILSLLPGACFPPRPQTSPPLKVGVCTSFRPLVDEIARTGLWNLEVAEGPSQFIIRGFEAGEFDLVIVAVPLPEATIIARDALAIIVHPGNSVNSLTLEELRRIYAGYVWDWSLLGGKGEVVIVSREEGSGARAFFEENVMKGERLSPAAVVIPSSREVLDYVALRAGAIGYISASWLNKKVKAVLVEGKAVSSPDYPLKLPAYAASRTEAGFKFIEFLKGPVGRRILSERYFLP
ncbi:MAG: substrate-binding domain-containing protein [Anaerolineae bacterium]|nr:substrate-binding domain-containing protein [Anaerolineae bacterium]